METYNSPMDIIAKSRFKGLTLVKVSDSFVATRSIKVRVFKIYKYKKRTMVKLISTNGLLNPYIRQALPLLDIDSDLSGCILDELVSSD